MKPIPFQSANKTLTGTDDVEPLPVYDSGDGLYISRWKASWKERLNILLFGVVWVGVMGRKHPPIAITGDRAARFDYPRDH